MCQNAFIGIYAQLFRIRSILFLSYELLVLVVGLSLELCIALHLIYYVLWILFSSCKSHRCLLHFELLHMFGNVFKGLFIVCLFFLDPIIFVIVTEVSSVQYVIFDRVVVVCQRLKMVRSDKPLHILLWLLVLNILQIVVWR